MAKISIDRLPRIKVSDLKGLFKATSTAEEGVVYGFRFSFGDTHYLTTHSRGWGYVIIHFQNQQGEREVRVRLHREASNLGRGELVYFLCPYTAHKCRKLFLDGKVVASRYAFEHSYSYQNHSHRERLLDGLGLIELMNADPHRKNGKPYYKGKPTRYLKRIERYWQKVERAERNIKLYAKPTQIGRPPKSRWASGEDMGVL